LLLQRIFFAHGSSAAEPHNKVKGQFDLGVHFFDEKTDIEKIDHSKIPSLFTSGSA
jgi:hypothetical protein